MANKIIYSKTEDEERPEFRTSLSIFGNTGNQFNKRPFSRIMSNV
jgi:hypothetical protein